jgi:hypothetical protein
MVSSVISAHAVPLPHVSPAAHPPVAVQDVAQLVPSAQAK